LIDDFKEVKVLKRLGQNKQKRLGLWMTDGKMGYGIVVEVNQSKRKGDRLGVVTFF